MSNPETDAPNYPINLIHLWNGGPDEGWLAVQLRPGCGIRVGPHFYSSDDDVAAYFEALDAVRR